MKQKPKPPTIPRAAEGTLRRAIIDLLKGQRVSAKDISMAVHVQEKEVYDHLEHIRRSLHGAGEVLEVTPAECRRCGYVFSSRTKLKPPGKCPECRHEAIMEPLFFIPS